MCQLVYGSLADGLAGGETIIPLKHPRKGENIGIAHGQCRFAGGEAVAAQKFLRVLHAAAEKVLLGGKARLLAEHDSSR